MAFNIVKFIKGILISEAGTQTPKEMEIIPGGTASTKTTVTSSQTVNRTITIPDATDTLVAKNTTDLLTNKSLQDTTTAIVDILDPTKQIKFDAEGAAMTTTLIVSSPTVNRTLMLPDATDTLVARDTTDILTNKTLTAPVINTPDINMGTIDGTAINDSPIGQVTPAAGAFTTLSGSAISVAGDPVVTLTAPQTVTNKTLTAPNINNPVVSGGSINDTQIGNLVPDTAVFTTVNATSLDTTGNVIVGGDLTVNGTTTTLNTQTLDVEDSNITVNVLGNDASAEGAGLTVNRTGTDGSLIYKDLSPSKFAAGLLGSEDNVVTQTVSQTLTNKSLVDTTTVIVDSVDATKQIKFDAAGTTATSTTLLSSQTTNKTLILPDATDTLVARDTTDTLNNKTLSYLKATVADELTTGANATLSGSTFGVIRLVDGGLTTIAGIDAGLAGQQITVENVTGNSIDILDDDSAAVVGDRIYTGTAIAETLNANASFIFTYDAVNLHWMLTGGSGSGSGSGGGVNFIPNGDAEQTANPFVLYLSSGLTARPTGTQSILAGNFTATRTVLNPLAGDASWLINKGASINFTGPNIGIPFTVAPAYKAKSVKIKFDYRVVSGTFQTGNNIGTPQDSSLIVYIYDADNNVYIEPSNFRFLSNSSTIADHFEAEFQTNALSINYQLIYYVAVASAIPFSISVDNIAVSPNEYVFGTPVTNETAATGITSASFGATDISYQNWRVGDKLKVRGHFRVGTPTASLAKISLPSGLSIDVTKQTISQTHIFGSWVRGVDATSIAMASSGIGPRVIVINSTDPLNVQFATLSNANGGVNPSSNFTVQNANAIAASNDQISFEFEVPILGWSSSVQTSDQTSTRVVSAVAQKIANQAVTANVTNITYPSILRDTHGAFNGTTYTVAAPGDYELLITGSSAIDAPIQIYKNNILFSQAGELYSARVSTQGATLYNLLVGDLITLRSASSTTINGSNSAGQHTISFSRISGPSVVSSTEVVVATYYASVDVSTTANNPINFNTRELDTHNAVTTGVGTWRFTAPVSGVYFVGGYLRSTVVNAGANMIIFKNGVSYKFSGLVADNGGASVSINTPSVLLQLNAGDFIDLRPSINSTFGGGVAPIQASISIHKINGVN